MSTKECCRTCDHCGLSQSKDGAWCRLRRIRVHAEMDLLACCHHWTAKEPSLPNLEKSIQGKAIDLQLEFGRVLAINEG